ncbi:MAG: hypothetical protein H0T78_00170 [Longispora sp.]|nr:hypothetical protein [Longispora sp. (in: high G+C Gram-positive bacteria)]
MADRYSLSILDRYDDGSSASHVWAVSAMECEQIRTLLNRPADVEGLITAEQAEEASRVTQTWLTSPRDEPDF